MEKKVIKTAKANKEMNKNAIILVLILVAALAVIWGASYFFRTSEKNDSHLPTGGIRASKLYSGATLKTNKGDITIEFLSRNAPKTVSNFIKLAESGFYDGVKFHRVDPGFMIQGGDPLTKDESKKDRWGTGDPGYKFNDEINWQSLGIPVNDQALLRGGYSSVPGIESVRLTRGIMAMANSGPNTNGSQFFIITASETPWLNGKHTGFARVTNGMEVVDAISKVGRDVREAPIEPVVIEKVTLH
ncbi:MAG: peptidylprolyl isomerase [bacterium]|nr:peptidylprolyl isomerase [bacterium]